MNRGDATGFVTVNDDVGHALIGYQGTQTVEQGQYFAYIAPGGQNGFPSMPGTLTCPSISSEGSFSPQIFLWTSPQTVPNRDFTTLSGSSRFGVTYSLKDQWDFTSEVAPPTTG